MAGFSLPKRGPLLTKYGLPFFLVAAGTGMPFILFGSPFLFSSLTCGSMRHKCASVKSTRQFI